LKKGGDKQKKGLVRKVMGVLILVALMLTFSASVALADEGMSAAHGNLSGKEFGAAVKVMATEGELGAVADHVIGPK